MFTQWYLRLLVEVWHSQPYLCKNFCWVFQSSIKEFWNICLEIEEIWQVSCLHYQTANGSLEITTPDRIFANWAYKIDF